MFTDEITSANQEAYDTGKRRSKKRGKKVEGDTVKINKKGPIRKKTSMPKKNILKK